MGGQRRREETQKAAVGKGNFRSSGVRFLRKRKKPSTGSASAILRMSGKKRPPAAARKGEAS